MKSKNIFSGLLIVAIVAVLAYFVLAEVVDQADINNAQLISPTNNQNISGSFLINITSPWRNETAGVYGNFTNVTLSFWNSTDNSLVTRLVLTDNNTDVNQTFNITQDSVGFLTDGVYNLSINATNASGDIELENRSVFKTASDFITIDNTVPDVTITSPVENQNFTSGTGVADGIGSSNITFAIRVQNVSGTAIHAVLFEITNGSSPFNLTAIALNTTVYNASINVTSTGAGDVELNITDGNHTVIVFTNDTAGNVNRSMNVTFIVDTTAPNEVIVLNMTDAFNTSKTIPTFSFNASDGIGGLMNCSLYVDGVTSRVNVSNINASNRTLTEQLIDSAGLADGRHNWSVQCTDSVRLGNVTSVVGGLNFTVDTVAPDVQTLANNFADRTNFTGNASLAINITFNATVGNGSNGAGINVSDLHVVYWNISNGSSTFQLGTGLNGSGGIYSPFNATNFNGTVNVSQMSEGNHTAFLVANDTAGNLNNTVNITFIIDNTNPNEVVLINMTDMFNTSKTVPTFSFNASDGIGGLMNCSLYVDGVTSRVNVSNINASNRTLTEQLIDSAGLADGRHNWSVQCTDSVRLGNVTSVVGGLNFTVDTVAPDVQTLTNNFADRTNFTGNASLAINITFNATVGNGSNGAGINVSDLHVVYWNISNGSSTFQLGTGLNGSGGIYSPFNATNFNGTVNVSQMSEGNHTAFLVANDTAGHLNNTVNITFIIDNTAPEVVIVSSLVTNLSGTGTTNISKNVPTFQFNATDGIGSPQNCTIYIDRIANITNLNASNRSQVSQVAERSLIDGTHNWSVQCTDSVRLGNISLLQNFTVVTTAPTVNIHNVSFRSSNSTPTISFNYTHGILDTANCTLYNVTDSVRFNSTFPLANATDTKWRINTTLGEGGHEIYVNCTSPALTEGSSTQITITVDQTAPTITVSTASSITSTSAKLEVTTGESATCKYDTVDTTYDAMTKGPMDGAATTSHSHSVSGLTASSSYSYYVRCKDTVQEGLDNKMGSSASIGFTTSAEGGGGGGGGGGGVSSGAAGAYEKGIWQSIFAGETASVQLKNGQLSFTEVSFVVKETTYGAWIEVRKVDTLPSTVTAFGEKAYRTIRITESNVEKVLQGKPLIQFKVLKTWISDNKLTKESIALFRYVDGQWNELPTTVGEDDGTYVHYKSTTPGFSYFVVGIKGAATPIGQEVSTVPSEVTTPAGEQPAVSETTTPEEAGAAMKKKSIAVWLVPLVVLVALAAILYLYWRRK